MTTVSNATSTDSILNALSRSATTSSTESSSAVDDAQSRFLKLLTTQLQNQDPLNPQDNAETTSQLAQISTVDGIERLNKTLESFTVGAQSNEAYQASALVGHAVLVPGTQLQLVEGVSVGGVDLAEDADSVTVSIVDANGLEVARQDLGELEAGSHEFVWDGTTTSGEQAADGVYKVKITATAGSDKVDATLLELAQVNSVVNDGGGLSIDVGRLGKVQLSDIRRIL